MDINVRYHNFFYLATGKRTEQVVIPEGSTVEDLIIDLLNRYGEPRTGKLGFRRILNSEGRIEPAILIFCNGRYVVELPSECFLKDNDNVDLFHAIGGG